MQACRYLFQFLTLHENLICIAMDSSKQLIEALRQIGYPNVESLDPNSIEWSFENSATRPFLKWFYNNISLDNVVTEQEIQEFSELEAKGAVLTGQQLSEHLEPLKALHLDEEHLRLDIKDLKETLEKVKARKELLMKRTNDLSVHHIAQKNKVMKLRAVEDQSQKNYKQSVEKCISVNAQLGGSVEKLAGSVTALAELYSNSPSAKTKADFLSQTELKAFHGAEEKFSKDLTAFTKKQFFNGVADLTGDKEATQYSLLDVSQTEPATPGKESDGDTFHSDCREFARIQEIFPQSECDCTNALINTKKAASAVQEARSILHLLKTDQFPKSTKEIIQRYHSAEQCVSTAQAEATPLLSAMPDLIHELGALQGTNVLTGDYNLKLRRQDYFSKNQDKVIEHLVSQRARNEFLSMLYEVEIRWHKETHRLVTAARQALEGHLLSWQQRMKELSDPDLAADKPEPNVVDVRDTSSTRLHQMLNTSKPVEDKPLYLQTQKMVARAVAMATELEGATLAGSTADDKYSHTVDQLEVCSADCASVLYADSSTSRGCPNLSQPDVHIAMVALTAQLNQLEKCIKDVVDDIDSKKTTLKNNVLLGKERELFVLFHNNPSRLQYVVNGLAERAKAQELQES